MSKMMRISDLTNKQLDELVAETGKTKQYLLERAIKLFAREMFLRKANLEYERLTKDQKKEYQSEVEEWNITLEDGLEPHE